MTVEEFCRYTGFVNFVCCFLFAVFILQKNPTQKANQAFALFSFLASIWSLGYFLWLSSNNDGSAYFWVRFLAFGCLLIPPPFFAFCVNFLGIGTASVVSMDLARGLPHFILVCGIFAIAIIDFRRRTTLLVSILAITGSLVGFVYDYILIDRFIRALFIVPRSIPICRHSSETSYVGSHWHLHHVCRRVDQFFSMVQHSSSPSFQWTGYCLYCFCILCSLKLPLVGS